MIRGVTLAVPEVESIGRLLTMQLAPDQILINMDVDLIDGLTAADVEAVIDRIEADVHAAVPAASRIFIEPDSRP